MSDSSGFLSFLILVWMVFVYVQMFLGVGTAYRFTKRGGDNGVALCGWMVLFYIAALVPGLGIYFWMKYREPKKQGQPAISDSVSNPVAVPRSPVAEASAKAFCKQCGAELPADGGFCEHCGAPIRR